MLTRRPANGVDRPVPATSAVTEEDDDPGNLPTMLPMSMPPAAGGAGKRQRQRAGHSLLAARREGVTTRPARGEQNCRRDLRHPLGPAPG